MLTADLPVGAHVAFNSHKANNYVSLVEAFVIAHRPKGNKYSSWGLRTGNGDTVGIASTRSYWKDEQDKQIWEFEWVRPADIHMTWDAFQDLTVQTKRREADRKAVAAAEKADRKARWAALPSGVRFLIPEYKAADLIDRSEVSMYVSVRWFEQIVAAAQAELPERKAERVAAEVEAALQLLG